MGIKRRSAKEKGKRAVLEARAALLRHAPHLLEEDIVKPRGSRSGCDLKLSEQAIKELPFAIEIKNQERLNIWDAVEQTERHAAAEDLLPLLLFKKNHSPLYATLRLEDLLSLIQRARGMEPQATLNPVSDNSEKPSDLV